MKMLDSLANLLEKENQQKFKKQKFYPQKYKPKVARPVRLFDFDPNQVSVDQMEELGIPAFLAKRIDKFRSKGGRFRKKEDLLNIYDCTDEPFGKTPGRRWKSINSAGRKILSGQGDLFQTCETGFGCI
jgi:hypothetical protein